MWHTSWPTGSTKDQLVCDNPASSAWDTADVKLKDSENGPLAESIATRDGDASPTSAGGDTVDAGGTAVDFVVMQGSFIAKMAFGPNGDDVPTGSVLAFTVDPASHTVLDLSLNDAVPDLSSLGAPQALVLTVNNG